MIAIASDKELSVQVALAEFTALRAEVLQAFSMQWNVIALQLTATGVLFSFSLTNRTRTGFLLIVPIVSYVLNGIYLRSEHLITQVADYVMRELSPSALGGLGWEKWLRDDPSRHKQYTKWFAHGPLIFAIISMVALAWVAPYTFSANGMPAVDRFMLIIVWVLDFSLTTVSIYAIKVVFKIHFPRRQSRNRHTQVS